MDLSCNSELLTYARYNSDDNDVYEDSFVVLDRENQDDYSPTGQQMNGADELMAALQSATISDPSSCESQASVIQNTNAPMTSSEQDDDVEVSMEMKRMLEENQELKRKIRELNEQSQQMQAKFTHVGEILSNVKKSREEELVKFEQCRKTVEELTKENAELKEKIKSLEDEVTKLNEQLKSACASSEASAQLKELEQNLKTKEEALCSTEELLQAAQKRAQEIEELWNNTRYENAELKDKLRISEARSDAAASGSEENIRTLRSQADEFHKKSVELNAKLIEKDDEIQVLRGQLESSQLSLEEYRMTHEEKRAEIAALNDARSKILSEVETLHHALATKSAALHELHQSVADKERQCDTLQQQIMEKDSMMEDLMLTSRRNEELCAKYQEKVAELNEEIKRLQEVGEIAGSQQVAQLRNTISKLDDENAALRTQVAALATENEMVSHWKAQCEIYAQDFQRVVTEKEELEKKVTDLSKESMELKEQNEKLEKELRTLHQHHLRLAQEHVDGNSQAELSAERNDNRSGDDDIVGYLFNQVKKGVSYLWEPEPEARQATPRNSASPNVPTQAQSSSTTETQADSPTAEAAATGSNTGGSGSGEGRLPPCPVCGRAFRTLSDLERHCGTCGDNSSFYGSHLDPFVFIPNQ